MHDELFFSLLEDSLLSDPDKAHALTFILHLIGHANGMPKYKIEEMVKIESDNFYVYFDVDIKKAMELFLETDSKTFSEKFSLLKRYCEYRVYYCSGDYSNSLSSSSFLYGYDDEQHAVRVVEILKKFINSLWSPIKKIGNEIMQDDKIVMAIEMISEGVFNKKLANKLAQKNPGLYVAYFYCALAKHFSKEILSRMSSINSELAYKLDLQELFPAILSRSYRSEITNNNYYLVMMHDFIARRSHNKLLSLSLKKKIFNNNVRVGVKYQRIIKDSIDDVVAIFVRPEIDIKIGNLKLEVEHPMKLSALISKYLKFREVVDDVMNCLLSEEFINEVKSLYIQKLEDAFQEVLLMKEQVK